MTRYLRRPAVSERYGIPASTLYDWIAKGQFPKPVRLGARSVAWSIAELEAWERGRLALRGGDGGLGSGFGLTQTKTA